jgi:cytochrome c-type biogenesis protein CcmH
MATRRLGDWEAGLGFGTYSEGILRGLAILIVLLAVLLLPSLLAAQVPDSLVAARTKHIATQLRCPVCQGLSLQESQSELSHQMKGVIADQIRAGKSDDQVIDYFVAKYGEWILLEPRAHGFNLAVYVLPFVVLIGGTAVLYFSVKRWTSASAV